MFKKKTKITKSLNEDNLKGAACVMTPSITSMDEAKALMLRNATYRQF